MRNERKNACENEEKEENIRDSGRGNREERRGLGKINEIKFETGKR